VDRFTHHGVKSSPAAEAGSFSVIAADKVSTDNASKQALLQSLHGNKR